MEWISVEKKPPEDNVLYAVCIYNDLYKKSLPANYFATFEEGKWYWYDDDEVEIEDKVTHYMELEFPKEG